MISHKNLSQLLLVAMVGFVVSVLLQSYFPGDALSRSLFVGIVGLSVGAAFFRFKKIVWVLLIIFTGAFSIGSWYTQDAIRQAETQTYDTISVNGFAEIVLPPEKTENSQHLQVRFEQCEFPEQGESPCPRRRVLIFASLWQEYHYGDKVQLSCILETPENFTEEFDWRMYLAMKGVGYICGDYAIHSVQEIDRFSLYSYLINIQQKLEQSVNSTMPYPEAALANGLLVGGSDRMSEELQNDFSQTSMTHIVAVSGYNVAILAHYGMLIGIGIGLWRKQAFWLAVIFIIAFVAMIGFPASAIRAAVMGVVVLWAMRSGRLHDSFNAILFAVVLMLAWNPLLLRWDVGFQLSVLATLGIVSFAPLWEKIAFRSSLAQAILGIVFVTLSAQVLVLPIILSNFHSVSLLSPLTNLLVLFTLPIAMAFSFLGGIAGLFSSLLGMIMAFPAYILLKFDIAVIQYVAHLEWASFHVQSVQIFFVLLWYSICALIIVSLRRKELTNAILRCKSYTYGK